METWLREVLETADRAWNRATPTTQPTARDDTSPCRSFLVLPNDAPHATPVPRELYEGLLMTLPDMASSYTYPGFVLHRPVAVDTIGLTHAINHKQTLIASIYLLCRKERYDAMCPTDAAYRILYAFRAKYGVHVRQINHSVQKVLIPDHMDEGLNFIISVSEEL